MSISKAKRLIVYKKYNGKCAYCGKEIQLTDMQVDHIIPQRICTDKETADRIENLNPSCRRCNHYKRARSIERFRELLMKLHTKIQEIYIGKVAEDYGVIKVEPWNGKFYFEKVEDTKYEKENILLQ